MDFKEFSDFSVDFIRDRDELFLLLGEAAEFEHTVMCSYLYTMMTLKRSVDEGVTADELVAINRWRQAIRSVAFDEMVHFCLVNNLITALGGSPHFNRPDFPVPVGRFPADYEFTLAPFSESTIQHFMYIERPLDADVKDGASYSNKRSYYREIRTDLYSPTRSDYPTQGHLYHSIAFGLRRLAADYGEAKLFAGGGDAQLTADVFGIPELFAITDLASAERAIEKIVVEGEGAPSHSATSHFASFSKISVELAALKAARPAFDPARPAALNPRLLDPIRRQRTTHVTHPLSLRIVDLGNCIYVLMLRCLAQAAAPYEIAQSERAALGDAAVQLMYAFAAMGDAATRSPLKAGGGGRTAGLSLETHDLGGALVKRCATQLLSERALQLGSAVRQLPAKLALASVADQLEGIGQGLLTLANQSASV